MGLKENLKTRFETVYFETRENLRVYGRSLIADERPQGYDEANTDRRLRELTREGLIEPLDKNGNIVEDSRYIVAYRRKSYHYDDYVINIEELFKEIKPMALSENYIRMARALRSFQASKTDADKERFKKAFMFFYEKCALK